MGNRPTISSNPDENSGFGTLLCSDVIGVIYGFLDFETVRRCSLVNSQWYHSYRKGGFWKIYLERLFPSFHPIPDKYRNKLTPECFRYCYLSIKLRSSWEFDPYSIYKKTLKVSSEIKVKRVVTEKISGKEESRIVTDRIKSPPNTILSTRTDDSGKNRSCSTRSKYFALDQIDIHEEEEKDKMKKEECESTTQPKIHFEVLELEVLEENPGNYSFGITNNHFTYDWSFCGYGRPIEDPEATICVKTSYGYASNGVLRKNYSDDTPEGCLDVPKYTVGDRIAIIWEKYRYVKENPIFHENIKEDNVMNQKNGHNFWFFKNGILVGRPIGESFQIRTRELRPTVTLYNRDKGDVNSVKIVTSGLKINFWEHLFPLILKDFGTLVLKEED